MIYLLDHSFLSPYKNIAYDEILLNFVETNTACPGILRFWESNSPFVVLGWSNKLDSEVKTQNCFQDNIPILRRCSGGGTILQGPGCLNYTLCLPVSYHEGLRSIDQTNQLIMSGHQKSLSSFLPNISIEGFTDLAIDTIKFSGNAQRRLKRSVLFHGTFLIDFDLSTIETYLSYPSKTPDYRSNRSHSQFLRNLPIKRESIKESLCSTWNAIESFIPSVLQDLNTKTQDLTQHKYSTEHWTKNGRLSKTSCLL